MKLFLSTLLFSGGEAASDADTAKRLYDELSCDAFSIRPKLFKKQLYTDGSAIPSTNLFTVGDNDSYLQNEACRYFLPNNKYAWFDGSAHYFNDQIDLFGPNDANLCGTTVGQDATGISASLTVKGANSGVGSPRTIHFHCFWPTDGNTPPAEATSSCSGATCNIYKNGDLDLNGFTIFDVRNDITKKFHPYTKSLRMHKVGTPVMLGVKPVAKINKRTGVDENLVSKHASRWNYYIRDCWVSGIIDGNEQKDIQIVKKNCKNSNYQIQKASKYGGDHGHIIMFEAMGIVGADATHVSCTVDVCLVDPQTGEHYLTDCYEECTDTLTWTDALTGAACSPDDGNDLCVSHTASSGEDGTALWVEEHDFYIPETTLKPEQFTTEAFDGDDYVIQDTGSDTLDATVWPDMDIEPDTSELALAKAECLKKWDPAQEDFLPFENGDGQANDAYPALNNKEDHPLWVLCNYIKALYPADFSGL